MTSSKTLFPNKAHSQVPGVRTSTYLFEDEIQPHHSGVKGRFSSSMKILELTLGRNLTVTDRLWASPILSCWGVPQILEPAIAAICMPWSHVLSPTAFWQDGGTVLGIT